MAASEAEIRDFCVEYLRKTLDLPPDEVAADANFARVGLDSASSVHLLVELEDWLGVELDPETVFVHPTVGELAHHVAEIAAGSAGSC